MSYIIQIHENARHRWTDVEEHETLSVAEANMRECARDEPDYDHRIVAVLRESDALSERVTEEGP